MEKIMIKLICVVLIGVGISVESGILIFCVEDGLWVGYKIEEVCMFEVLKKNCVKVLEFYNECCCNV